MAISIKGVSLKLEFIAADGRRVEHDFGPWLNSSGSLNRDMDESAAKIAWAGAVLGLILEAYSVIDAEYRAWRSDEGERILSMNDKISEWKVKQLVESSPDFLTFQKRKAEMLAKVREMEIITRALASQADTLRSRGANRRAEMRAINMTTPEEEPQPEPHYATTDFNPQEHELETTSEDENEGPVDDSVLNTFADIFDGAKVKG